MPSWEEFNKQLESGSVPSNKPSQSWQDFNRKFEQQSFQREAQAFRPRQEGVTQQFRGVDPGVYQTLRRRGVSSGEILDNLQPQETPGFVREFATKSAETATGLFDQMIRNIRGVSEIAAAPIAGALALPRGGATPRQAMTESLRRARDIMTGEADIDISVKKAAQDYLEATSEKDPRGGYKPTVGNVTALTALGFANLFGDPAFELGIGLKGARALKEFGQFKKVGQTTKALGRDTKLVRGTGRKLEIPIGEDLKVTVKPRSNQVVIKGYKKRFPSQKNLPEGQLSDETADLILNTRETTGAEITAKFEGDDLVMSPKEPIKETAEQTAQPTAKITQEPATAAQEAVDEVAETKTPRLSQRVEQGAIENDLTQKIGGLPEYEVANMQEQARMATDLINSDFGKAKRVAMGLELPEGNLLPESVFVALEDYALKKGDVDLIRQLARSHTTEQATFMGQRIRALGERSQNSATKEIRNIEQARARKNKVKNPNKKIREEATKEQKKLQREMRKVAKDSKELEDFINSIQC